MSTWVTVLKNVLNKHKLKTTCTNKLESNNLNTNLNCVFYMLIELQFCLYGPAFISSRISYIFKIVFHGLFKYANIVCYYYGISLEILLNKFKILKVFFFCSI